MAGHAVSPARLPTPGPLTRLGSGGDERLAEQVAGARGEVAFGALYERYYQPLYRYCRAIVRHDSDAEDALQSTFERALTALKAGRRDAPVRPWLFRIAHNEAVSVLRRRRAVEEPSEQTEDRPARVEERVEERRQVSLLLEDLRELPERQRSALVLRELSGLSHEEIAVALESSVGAAKQTIFEARRALQEFAEGRTMPCEQVRQAISDADGRRLRGRRMRAHLRDCAGCAAFADAIPVRTAELRALVPALPAVSAAGLLSRVIGAGSSHGGSSGGIAAAAAGKTAIGAVVAKVAAVAAVVATAGAGVAVVAHRSGGGRSVSATATALHHRAAGTGSAATDLPPGSLAASVDDAALALPWLPHSTAAVVAAAAKGHGRGTARLAAGAAIAAAGAAGTAGGSAGTATGAAGASHGRGAAHGGHGAANGQGSARGGSSPGVPRSNGHGHGSGAGSGPRHHAAHHGNTGSSQGTRPTSTGAGSSSPGRGSTPGSAAGGTSGSGSTPTSVTTTTTTTAVHGSSGLHGSAHASPVSTILPGLGGG